MAAALGLAALLAASTWAFDLVKWAGAGYLLWLAWGIPAGSAASGPHLSQARRPPPLHCRRRRFHAQGVMTNVLIIRKLRCSSWPCCRSSSAADAASKPLAFLLLGAVFVVDGTLFLFAVVALAHQARRVSTRPASQRALDIFQRHALRGARRAPRFDAMSTVLVIGA